MSLCHKLWNYNLFVFGTQCRKSLIFQTYIIWSSRIHGLKYLRSTTLESKDIGFRKAEFVEKTQFLYSKNSLFKNGKDWFQQKSCSTSIRPSASGKNIIKLEFFRPPSPPPIRIFVCYQNLTESECYMHRKK